MAVGQAVINSSSSGDIVTVAAPTGPGAFIRVISWHVTSGGATVVTLKSGSTVIDGTESTTISGGGIVVSECESGVCDCEPGQALVVNNSNAVAVLGVVRYVVKGAG
jgi:hypothetical protein